MLVKGKVALVTGGASGIGLACIEELLKNYILGVVLVDVDEQNGIEAASNFNNKYGKLKVIFVNADVRDKNQFEAAFLKAIETFNQLDIFFNNAGICDENNYENCLDINLKGTVHGLKLAIDKYLPKYKSGKDAIIINTASIAGLTPLDAVEIYTTTKFGVIGLTRSFGCDYHYERTGVKVIAICPSVTNTPLIEKSINSIFYTERASSLTEFIEVQQQTAEELAKCFIRVIEKEVNGSAWVIEGGKESKVEFPELFKI